MICGRPASTGRARMPATVMIMLVLNNRSASLSTTCESDRITLIRPKMMIEMRTMITLIVTARRADGVPANWPRETNHTNSTAASVTVATSSSSRCRSPRLRAPSGRRYSAAIRIRNGTIRYADRNRSGVAVTSPGTSRFRLCSGSPCG